MKTLLVLCTLVAAAACCEFSEIVTRNNCIGIKHMKPGKTTPDSNGYLEPGSWELTEICCDQPFDANTQIRGFKKHMKSSDIASVIDVNYSTLAQGKTNCQKGLSGAG